MENFYGFFLDNLLIIYLLAFTVLLGFEIIAKVPTVESVIELVNEHFISA